MFLLSFFIIAFVFCTFTIYYFHNRFNKKYIPENNEVTGILFGASSLFFSLITSFAIVAVWTDYEELNGTIEKETDKLNSILVHSNELPDSVQHLIKADIRAYCKIVINEEWDQDNPIISGPSAIPALRIRLNTINSGDARQAKALSLIDDMLADISDLHRERLSHTHSHVPDFVWVVLVLNSVITIYISFFFLVSSERLKRGFIALLSVIIAMSLFLIYVLDHPFAQTSPVSNEAYRQILSFSF